jgi:hypothetical protein
METLLADLGLLDAVDIVRQYGPFCGCLVLAVIFFIWRDWKREDKLTKRIAVLEDETRNVLLPLVKDCTSVISRNTLVMERLEKHLDM